MPQLARIGVITACGIVLLTGSPVTAQAAAPLCFGQAPTIVGTNGPDWITTRPGIRDVVYAGGGDDVVGGSSYLADPGDLICGGPGNDNLDGGIGNDRINGGDGHDQVTGAFGTDLLQGNAGNDRIYDSDGDNDWPDSKDPGTDTIRGGGGNDEIHTVSGADKVYGEGGADRILDFSHARTYLYGGPGDDYIDARGTNFGPAPVAPDYVFGDDGIDTAVVQRHDVVSTCERITYAG